MSFPNNDPVKARNTIQQSSMWVHIIVGNNGAKLQYTLHLYPYVDTASALNFYYYKIQTFIPKT